jgi:hypothetical protein
MSGCQADTFQRTLLIDIRPTVILCAAFKKTCAASIFISCTTYMWDVVGHFLGCSVKSPDAGGTGLLCHPASTDTASAINYFK